jgi:preprotein translocase subunit SecE
MFAIGLGSSRHPGWSDGSRDMAKQMAKPDAAPQGVAQKKKRRVTPIEFLAQVRSEGEKVTWPTRKETMITSAMVFVMAIVASIFFLMADFIMQKAVGLVLGIGS